MLYKETVEAGTLDLIFRLMRDSELSFFYLVGGTALSLKIGHRKSIDIDMFCSVNFDGPLLAQHLINQYNAEIKRVKSNYVSGNIGVVAFDFICHNYPEIKPIEQIEGIRMMSVDDISAMKINAIVNSGQRVKDFIDIYYLLKIMSLKEILDNYCLKYPDVNTSMAKSSLSYHADIDLNVPVMLMDKTLKWKNIADCILLSVKNLH
jgi:hypothetical protein